MKARFINLKRWLLLTAAGLFGINTACAPSMYGCPMSDYEVKGTVSDADGNPLPGVAVKMRCAADTTDAQGRYDILERNGSWLDTLEVGFHDTADVYADTSVPVSFEVPCWRMIGWSMMPSVRMRYMTPIGPAMRRGLS